MFTLAELTPKFKRHWRTKGRIVRVLTHKDGMIEAVCHLSGKTLGFYRQIGKKLMDITR